MINYELTKKLREYINLMDDEVSESANLIIQLYEGYSDYISPQLLGCLEGEMKDSLKFFEDNMMIVKRTEKGEDRIYKELVYRYEEDD